MIENVQPHKNNTMTRILGFLTFLSLLVILLQAGLRGALSPQTIAIALVIAVVCFAALRPKRRDREEKPSLARALFGIGLPVTSFLVFLIAQGDGNLQGMGTAAGSVLALLIALLGIYIIVAGVFRR